MFGFKSLRSRNQQTDDGYGTQVPPQVYESVRTSPGTAQYRTRLALFIAAGVGLLVLLAFGTVRLYQYFSDKYSGDGSSSQSTTRRAEEQGGIVPNANDKSTDNAKKAPDTAKETKQDPQNDTLPKPKGQPATTSVSESTSSSPVDRPQ